jgi:hypothetical protein
VFAPRIELGLALLYLSNRKQLAKKIAGAALAEAAKISSAPAQFCMDRLFEPRFPSLARN